VRPVVYDTGVLIAAERNVRRSWAEHRIRLEAGVVPLVPAAVVAQASRSATQAQLRRLLRGCEVIAFTEPDAHQAGSILGKSQGRDVVDASVVVLAVQSQANVVTDDSADISRLLRAAGSKLLILPV
jgi:predicted nucleic acid-binding protein